MAGYTKEFLIDAFMSRYVQVFDKKPAQAFDDYFKMITNYYDEVGKDKFRVYASLDADALKKFKLATGRKS